MRTGTAALLAILSAAAYADPPPPTSGAACKPSGDVLVEVAQRIDPGHKLITATTKLFANGTVQTDVIDVDGKPMRSSRRCLSRAEVDDIVDDLKTAKWRLTRVAPPCGTKLPRFTVYSWNGKSMFTERACSPTVLDEESRRTIERLSTWLAVPALDGAPACGNPLVKGCS